MITPDGRTHEHLDDLEAETVEDLEVAEDDGEDVRGGTSGGCMTF